jgi:hypothetical protein
MIVSVAQVCFGSAAQAGEPQGAQAGLSNGGQAEEWLGQIQQRI